MTWEIFCSYFTEWVFYTFGCIFPFHLWFSTSRPLIMSHRTYMLFSYVSLCCCLNGLVHQSHLESPNFFPSLHFVDQVRLPIQCLCVTEFFKISEKRKNKKKRFLIVFLNSCAVIGFLVCILYSLL